MSIHQQLLKATLHIGKNGVTDSFVDEVKNALRTRKMIKIAILRSSGVEVKDAAYFIASRVGASVESVLGRTFVVKK